MSRGGISGATPSPKDPTVAVIAGSGRFPFHVAQEAKRQGFSVIGVGIAGWADPTLASHVDAYDTLAVGELERLIAILKSRGVSRAIMAGKITKAVLLDARTAFDREARAVLRKAPDASAPAVLGAIGRRLQQEGITLLDSSAFLKAHLCPPGVVTARSPTAAEAEGIRIGVDAARALARFDIGQTVVVKDRVMIAVEALEGTDAAIRRAHALAGNGLVVVKMASPGQDRRFDLPVVGLETAATLRESGVSCLAVEAGTTVLLDRNTFLASVNAAGICVTGVAPP